MYFEKENKCTEHYNFLIFTKNDVFACSCFCFLKDQKMKAHFIPLRMPAPYSTITFHQKLLFVVQINTHILKLITFNKFKFSFFYIIVRTLFLFDALNTKKKQFFFNFIFYEQF